MEQHGCQGFTLIDRRAQRGFTLIELSIVLVIIGLIVGGILVGQDMIRAAELRATVGQVEKYNTAVNTFLGKYGGLPGDLNYTQAQALGFFTFPNACGTGAGSMGCGDGNGLIENEGGSGAYYLVGVFPRTNSSPTPQNQADASGEQYAFWRHLSDAGLIDGSFGATLETDVNLRHPYTNVAQYFPPAKIGNNMYFVVFSDGVYNYFGLGTLTSVQPLTPPAAWGNPINSPIGLTPIDAAAIDTKLDDGLPNSGSVFATNPAWYGNGPGYPGTNGDVIPGYGPCIVLATDGVAPPNTFFDHADTYNTNPATGGTEPACDMAFRFN